MKARTIGIAVLYLLIGAYLGAQLQKLQLSVKGEMLQLDMSKEEANKKLSACCKAIPLGNAVIVTDKNNINQSFGMVYFEGNKVEGIAADRDWSADPASYETGLAFYRLVDELIHGTPTKVTLYAYSREASNGSDKTIVIMQGAKRIRLEMAAIDPSEKNAPPQSVTVSECIGACTDW